MKRRIVTVIMLLTLSMVVSVGCSDSGRSDSPAVETNAEDTEEQTVEEPTIEDPITEDENASSDEEILSENSVNTMGAPQIKIVSHNIDKYSEDGEHWLVNTEYQTIEVTGDGYETLTESIAQWSDRTGQEMGAATEQLAMYAEEALEYGMERDDYLYDIVHSIAVSRADSKVISFTETYYEYSGGAHGNYGIIGNTFDANSGELLQLPDILTDEEQFYDTANEMIIEKLAENEGLFSGYEEQVEQMWYQEQEPSWYLDASGITFIFEPYEIGPYALGVVEVTLPYEEIKEYIIDDYAVLADAGTAKIPLDESVRLVSADGNTQELKIWIDADEMYGGGPIYLELDGVETEVTEASRIGDAYLISRENGKKYIIFDVDYASDDYETFVYEISSADEGLRQSDHMMDLSLHDGTVNTENSCLRMHVDVLGTYYAYMTYSLDENGKLVQKEAFFQIPQNNLPYRLLTSVRELPVVINGETAILPTGSRIRIIATDNEEMAFFRDEDTGEEGEIHFVRGDGVEDTWTIFIDGDPDYDCFDSVPYAG